MYEDYQLSAEGHVVIAVIERAEAASLSEQDHLAAAILVLLARTMTDEQLDETHRALDQAAAGVASFPYNFLKFAQHFVTHRMSERLDALQEAEFAVFGEPDWDEVPGRE